MALFGPKSAEVPRFDRDRDPLDSGVKQALVDIGWIDEVNQPAIRDVPTHSDTRPVRVRFGTWDNAHYGLWTQIGRTTQGREVPYPFTRVKVLPYGFETFDLILGLTRIFTLGELPTPRETDRLAEKLAYDTWSIRDQAKNYGPIQ